MNDPRTVREIAEGSQEQIARIWAEIEEIKAQLRLFAVQLGWDPGALDLQADVLDPDR